jgi:prepilin-type N-terminal cleavage/methylation domain-containing protein
MRSRRYKAGFTLVEMLIVVAIIAILATMVVGIASRIDTRSKENLAKSTIAILTAALEQFHDYGYNYPSPYSEFEFPLDCNSFSVNELQTTLSSALGGAIVQITNHNEALNPKYREYSGCEVLYFFLSRIPECRETLDKIDRSLITNVNDDGGEITILIDGREYPFFRVVDLWRERGATTKIGKTLRYDYYNEVPPPLDPGKIKKMEDTKRNFPVITSAGPDGKFDTTDDISSR